LLHPFKRKNHGGLFRRLDIAGVRRETGLSWGRSTGPKEEEAILTTSREDGGRSA